VNILIVDDQRSARRILSRIVQTLDPDAVILEASSLEEARAALGQPLDAALIDIRLGTDATNRDGLTLVGEVRQRSAAVPIVVTASHEMAEIRSAMRRGAYDYILKDELCDELVAPVLETLRRQQSLEAEVRTLRARVASQDPEDLLVGRSPAMDRLRAVIRRVALSDRPVLVVGPTGSGKDVVVRTIHQLGPHPDAPLLDLNCAAIPAPLIESQLFGHVRSAFTGADRDQEGYFSAVRNGTLFLDEIAELPEGLQSKLLRAIESGGFRPLGTTVEKRFQGRIVAATHADLEARTREQRFREDLYYRLQVLEVRVPSLDERREDIPALAAHFIGKTGRSLRLTTDALDLLSRRKWPGNVRQLRNLIDRIAVFAESDEITPAVIEELSTPGARAAAPGASTTEEAIAQHARALIALPCANKMEAIEVALVEQAMILAQDNKSAAARLLGVHRKVIERRIEKPADAPADNRSE
jgi:DNA-binding NtrC family response regulator